MCILRVVRVKSSGMFGDCVVTRKGAKAISIAWRSPPTFAAGPGTRVSDLLPIPRCWSGRSRIETAGHGPVLESVVGNWSCRLSGHCANRRRSCCDIDAEQLQGKLLGRKAMANHFLPICWWSAR
jgi:hypothetical protein